MMVAMMLPVLLPMFSRYRHAVATTDRMRLGGLTAIVSLGYFGIWTLGGVVVFAVGDALAAIAMNEPSFSRVVPMAVGVVIVIAGALQLTRWKARRLACCHDAPGEGALSADARTAWRHGLRIGLRCVACCANLMAILLVVGVMDLRAMAVVTAAISAERLATESARVARIIGVGGLVAGAVALMRV